MGIYRDWIGIARRKFIKLEPQKTIIVLHPSDSESFTNEEKVNGSEEIFDFKEGYGGGGSGSSFKRKEFSKEGLAAIKIQAFFRGHLARRAYRALRSLVKLQAVVRGVCVRRQARVALHCMHALVQLQVRIRARQLLTRSDDD